MAAILTLVGEAALSSALEALFDKLVSTDVLKYARRNRVEAEVNKWKPLLLKLSAVLEDAEEKQLTKGPVKIWLDELRDLSYDVEDILDEFATHVLQENLMMGEPDASTRSKVRKLIPTCCSGFNPRTVKFNVDLGSRLAEITAKLEKISKDKSDLELRPDTASKTTISTSLVNESHVLGREKDKEVVIQLLFDESNQTNDAQLSVIPIVGMGGLGKTTLAQLIYKDENVNSWLDVKAWVYVSDEFDVLKISKSILGEITSTKCDFDDLNKVQEKLAEVLKGKKFLLILDDVWNESYEKWDVLQRPLIATEETKVVVTTRNESVSSIVHTNSSYHLKTLGDDDCLSVFAQHALRARNFDNHPKLKDIGEKIVKKCGGLPLAVKTLGGLLRGKLNHNEWERILNSELWNLPEEKSGILPALSVSYRHLPSCLKRCFAYCAMFPKDYKFDKDELVLLWMAEGFLEQKNKINAIEQVGSDYFDELLSRSFFQPAGDGSKFVMHDLINDLAQSVGKGICFCVDDSPNSSSRLASLEHIRHLSVKPRRYDVYERFEDLTVSKRLRTFLSAYDQVKDWVFYYMSSAILTELLLKLRHLRVLNLSYYIIKELPNAIGELKQLRYLNLSWTEITCLPESVCTLLNLQTLKLRGCEELIELPQGIGNLINLRHLDIAGTKMLIELPLGVSNLTNLRTFTKYIVGDKNVGPRLSELRSFSSISGEISILELQKVVDIQDAKDVNLKEKRGIDHLRMEWMQWWYESADRLGSEEHEMQVLNALQPYTNLKFLTISYYDGKTFPSWVGDCSFTKLERIDLNGFGTSIMLLPSLGGLPLLKHLVIKNMEGVKSVGREFYGPVSTLVMTFPSLETLIFEDLCEWEEWTSYFGVEGEVEVKFPLLESLTIENCRKLKGNLPSHLPLLRNLTISDCPLLKNSPSSTSLPSVRHIGLFTCHEVLIRSLVDLTLLTKLTIRNIMELQSFDVIGPSLQSLTSLNLLAIGRCEELVSFGETELPSSLVSLEIWDCGALKSLPKGIMVNDNDKKNCLLQELDIFECPSLTSSPNDKMPTTLKRLKIFNSKQCLSQVLFDNETTYAHLEYLSLTTFVPDFHFPNPLKTLSIERCEDIESFPKKMLLNFPTLENFDIRSCSKLRRLPESLLKLNHLRELTLRDCPSLECFPERGSPLYNLRSLCIEICGNLKSLPSHMQSFTSLQLLSIIDCPAMEFLPEDGLPLQLKNLRISKCENLTRMPLFERILPSLTLLSHLKIGQVYYGEPEPRKRLPILEDSVTVFSANLKRLTIGSLDNLESLTGGYRLPSCLEELKIIDCPNLKYLPKEGLPSTLGMLYIIDCPLLEERCLKNRGVYWPFISSIPCVEIDKWNPAFPMWDGISEICSLEA